MHRSLSCCFCIHPGLFGSASGQLVLGALAGRTCFPIYGFVSFDFLPALAFSGCGCDQLAPVGTGGWVWYMIFFDLAEADLSLEKGVFRLDAS